MIQIAINIDNNYVEKALVTITSILENTEENISLNVLTFDKTLNRSLLNEFKNNYSNFKEINYYELDRKGIKHSNHSFLQHISIATYGRLFIPKILSHLDKVIYMDTDLIFNGNIRWLWEVDVSKIPIAGALESKYVHLQGFFVKAKYPYMKTLDRHTYVNAGLLVLNPKLLDKEQFTEKSLSFMKEYNRVHFGDQDIINAIKGKVSIIDSTWNSTMGRMFFHRYKRFKEHNVVHYVTAAKPWKKGIHYKFVNYLLLGRQRTRYWKKYYKIYKLKMK